MEQKTKQEIKKNVTDMKSDILDELKEDIDRLVDTRNKELEDRKRREMNITIFNLEEHNYENGITNKTKMRMM